MIAKNQQAMLTILIAEQPSKPEIYAANELRHYLNMITGASFIISSEKNGAVIAVGQAAEKLGVTHPKISRKTNDDAFTIRRTGDSLAIAGGQRGVIYGVYELLEHFGCRFFTPICEKIPVQPDLPLPDIDTTQEPILEYRHHHSRDINQSQRFAVKSRNNQGDLSPDLGGGMKYAMFVHTFENLVGTEEYFDTHPEYFAMVKGERRRDMTQLCLTNKNVLEISINKTREILLKKPDCQIISISQNDFFDSFCTCPECAEIDEYEGSHAGSLIAFVNKLAERLEPEFPDVIFDTLAYQYSRKAPKYIRPRPNVCVRLCSIECCFSHSYEDCSDAYRNMPWSDEAMPTSFIKDLSDWAKVCDRMYIWDYVTNFASYPQPFPNWNVLQANMQALVKNNAKGVFEQGCACQGYSTDLNELRAYLISKLLWNADCDIERHKREFLDYYYGSASPHISDYIKTLTDKVEQENIHAAIFDTTDVKYLTGDMLDILNKIFDKAEQSVIGDPLRSARVAKARLSLRWINIKNKAMLKKEKDPYEINQFFTDWKAHGLTRIDEWVSAETTLRALLDGKWRGTEYYKYWWEEGREIL
jgi:hypothetical protein